MYTLYSLPGSCSTGITVLLHKLGVDFRVVNPKDVDNYSAVSPTGQVPALDADGLIITEGAAIALYLLERHGSDQLGRSLRDHAEFLRWLMFNYATLHPAYSKLFTAGGVMEDGPEKSKFMDALAGKVSETWSIINDRLADRDFMVGDEPTIIDYLLAIYTGWNAYFPAVSIDVGDNVRDLVARVADLPEFKAAFETEGNEFKIAA